ncbi:hypothetical protein [Rhodopirellula europaea]|uniref:Phosphoglycerate kinase n=1 Tax=Rhodopirellula europaea SH398 TaxID=1263868 RepID=M5RXX9_9BACT|nr:hypothetical protein [Rhodopirellula europaea]EMI24066.1 phosphoglycerate kinase [Rhodopirellula europaea SH398]
MGLDQYALITTETIDQEVDFKIPENACEIHYWRKHPNLHGWMQDLYHDKDGTKEFNCTPVVLNADDLDRLEAAIKANELPDTCGFFFGTTVGDEKEDDLKFIEKARQAIADGYTVFYDSWW